MVVRARGEDLSEGGAAGGGADVVCMGAVPRGRAVERSMAGRRATSWQERFRKGDPLKCLRSLGARGSKAALTGMPVQPQHLLALCDIPVPNRHVVRDREDVELVGGEAGGPHGHRVALELTKQRSAAAVENLDNPGLAARAKQATIITERASEGLVAEPGELARRRASTRIIYDDASGRSDGEEVRGRGAKVNVCHPHIVVRDCGQDTCFEPCLMPLQ